ncbi:hypothetical protein N7453_000150 [Penicillium expansum]|nr:hypothetical protein N7453_000150 [Penicillium expansum]
MKPSAWIHHDGSKARVSEPNNLVLDPSTWQIRATLPPVTRTSPSSAFILPDYTDPRGKGNYHDLVFKLRRNWTVDLPLGFICLQATLINSSQKDRETRTMVTGYQLQGYYGQYNIQYEV